MPVLVFAPRAGGGDIMALLLGIAAVLGHVFSVFVNSGAGRVSPPAPVSCSGWRHGPSLVAIVVWVVVVKLTGYVSLGSILGAAGAGPPRSGSCYPDRRAAGAGRLPWLAAMIVVLHRANIRRLLNGTEHRFGREPHDARRRAGRRSWGTALADHLARVRAST